MAELCIQNWKIDTPPYMEPSKLSHGKELKC